MKRTEVEQDQIPKLYGHTEDLLRFVDHVERDAFYNLQLMFKLEILPLMKQITKYSSTVSGCWWESGRKG